MARRTALTAAMLVIEIIVISLLAVLLAGGFAVMAITGPTSGEMTGFNSGLTMILMAAVMGVGAGALHFHRQEIEDHSRALESNARLLESNARLGREVQAVRRDLRTLMTMQTGRNNAFADELEARRAHKS